MTIRKYLSLAAWMLAAYGVLMAAVLYAAATDPTWRW